MEPEEAPHTEKKIHRRIHHHIAHSVSSNKPLLLALLAYFVLALVVFYPVSSGITTKVAGTGGDIYQMLWNNWWVGYATFTLHQSIWSTNLLFWPVGANLIYQTLIPIGSLIIYPFEAVSLAFAYNVLFFLGIVLSGLTMFVLSDYIVKNKYAAFIAGIIFTFSAFHVAQSYGHLEYANIEWIPLAIYLFLRIANKDYIKARYGKYLTTGALSVVFILAMFMGDVEQGVMLLMAFALIFIIYLASNEHRGKVLSKEFWGLMVVFVVVAFVLGSWAFVPFITKISNSTLNQLNDIPHNMLWSDDVLSYFLPGYYNGFFNTLSQSYLDIYHGDLGETVAYAGYIALALAAYGLYKLRKPTYLWIVFGGVFFLLSLGPYIQVGGAFTGTPGGVPGPYLLIKYLPGISILREPGRFDMMVSVALAVLGAFGASELLKRLRGSVVQGRTISAGMLATAVISLLIIAECAMPPLSGSFASQITTTVTVPQFYSQIGAVSGNFSVLMLPALVNQYSTAPDLYPGIAMYTTVFSHKSIIGGYLTRENIPQMLSLYNMPLIVSASSLEDGGAFSYLSPVYQNYTNQTLLTLYLYDTPIVAVDKAAYNSSELSLLEYYMDNTFGRYQYNDNSTIAWDTAAAASNALFRSYVAYPGLTYWNEGVYALGGQNITLWEPTGGGMVTVYAPYINTTGAAGAPASYAQTDNTIVNVTALSLSGDTSVLGIEQGTATGTSLIAEINLTGTPRSYTFSTELEPGQVENYLYFVSNNETPAGIVGITFSPGKNS